MQSRMDKLNTSELQDLIRRELFSKQRLLILDDVWDVDLLRNLKVLTLGGKSSCLVTSRRISEWPSVTPVALTTSVPCAEEDPPAFAEAMLASYALRDPEAEVLPDAVQVALWSIALYDAFNAPCLCCIRESVLTRRLCNRMCIPTAWRS
jgi:NB-ARC domain